MPTTFRAQRWHEAKRRCSHCECACRRCVPGQAGCTRTAGLGQSGCTAGRHAVPLGIWDTGQTHQSLREAVYRSRCSGRPFDLEASPADAVPTIPRAFLLSPFRNRGIRAGHIFCPSCDLPSLVVLVYSKEQCVSLRSRGCRCRCWESVRAMPFYCGKRSASICVVLGSKHSSTYSSEYASGCFEPAALHLPAAPLPRDEGLLGQTPTRA
jgi:hypothetical protein